MRDSAIQRFEYTIEIFWKVLKDMLEDQQVEAFSPRDVIRKACQINLLTDAEGEKTLEMLKFRNQTSHDYAMSIAKMLSPELPPFALLMRTFANRIIFE